MREPQYSVRPAGSRRRPGRYTAARTAAERARSGPTPAEAKSRKAVAAAAIGNAIEWFDFGIFGFLTLLLGGQFFPGDDPVALARNAFAVFAVSFLIRPLGGLFFGPLGDRIGRKRVLPVTILLMAGSTFSIGILPTYDQIGYWATALLVAARLMQGFSTGGEYAGAATFIAEYAPDRKRGFLGSWLEFGTLAGFTGGAGLVTYLTLTLSPDSMSSWGWRIPFLVALPLGLVGLYIRLRLDETPTFQECVVAHDLAWRSPLRKVVARNWPEMLLCTGLVVLLNATVYTLLVYRESYLTQVLGVPDRLALMMTCSVLLGMMVVIVPLGSLSDRIGRKPLLLTSGFGILFLSYPAFLLLSRDGVAAKLAGLAIIGLFLVCFQAVVGSTLPAIFDTRVRYSGFAISYNVATSLFGGTAPWVINFLVERTGSPYTPAFYLMTAAAVSIIPMLLIKETAGQPLRGTEATRRVADIRSTADEPAGPP
ncbi:MAG: MFS transporter [Pseudonocardiaceae bacterium]